MTRMFLWFRWFYPGAPVSSNSKTYGHDLTEILLKVALNTMTLYTSPTSLKYTLSHQHVSNFPVYWSNYTKLLSHVTKTNAIDSTVVYYHQAKQTYFVL
jgi:hypothetical protein